MMRWFRAAFATILMAAVSACSAGQLAENSFNLPYREADSFFGTGYKSRPLDKEKFEIDVIGTVVVPWSRLSAIAITRAAEIGVERKSEYFKVLETKRGVNCLVKADRRSGEVLASTMFGDPKLTLIVQYGPAAAGAGGLNSAATFAANRKTIDDHAPAADEKKQMINWVEAFCKRAVPPGPTEIVPR